MIVVLLRLLSDPGSEQESSLVQSLSSYIIPVAASCFLFAIELSNYQQHNGNRNHPSKDNLVSSLETIT
jgi:hypothetical protein